MKKWIVGLAVVAGLAYGGFKVYAYYEVKDAADRLVGLAAPFVHVSYGGIYTSVDGSAGVERIEVTVPTTGEVVRVERLAIDAHSPWRLLTLGGRFTEQGPPDALGLRVRGLQLDLRSRYIAQLASQGSRTKSPPDLGCGDVERFTPAVYRDMGYDELTVDVSADYAFDAQRRQASVDTSLTVRGAYEVTAHMIFDVGRALTAGRLASAKPRLKGMTGRLRDSGFVQRVIDYCADRAGVDRAAAIDAQMAAFDEQVRTSLGFEPDAATVTAYRRFLEGANTLAVAAEPPRPVDLSRLRFYDPADVPKLLGLEVTAR